MILKPIPQFIKIIKPWLFAFTITALYLSSLLRFLNANYLVVE
jgi:hypothetical protein